MSALRPGTMDCGFLFLQVLLGGAVVGLALGVVAWLAARGRERIALLVALGAPALPLAVGLYADEFRLRPDSVVASLGVARILGQDAVFVALPFALGLVGAWVFALPAIARARGASVRQQMIVALSGALVVAQALAPAAADRQVDDHVVFMGLFAMLLPAAFFGPIFFARGRVVARRVFSWLGQDPPGSPPVCSQVAGARVLLALGLSTVGFAWAIAVVPLPFCLEARWWGLSCAILRGPWGYDQDGLVWLAASLALWLAFQLGRGLDRPAPRAEIRASAALVAAAAAVRPCVRALGAFDWPFTTDVAPFYAGTLPFAAVGLVLVFGACALAGRDVLVRGALVALGAASFGLVAGETTGGRLVPVELVFGRAVLPLVGVTWPEMHATYLGALCGGVLAALLARLGRKGKIAALVLGLGGFPAVAAARMSGLLAPTPSYWTDGSSPPGAPLDKARAFEFAIGVPELPDEAQLWYERAAATGDREAIYRLAIRLEKGVWTPRDWPRAARLYEQAAKLGCGEAEGRLREMRESEVAAVISAGG